MTHRESHIFPRMSRENLATHNVSVTLGIGPDFWHFECPECGMTDEELDGPARAHVVHCEVCLEDERNVRLRRWPVEVEVRV